MSKGFFITGTDTGVGKTWFTVLLMRFLQENGVLVNGMKPIASGAEERSGRLVNEDATAILAACASPLEYDEVNPFLYEPPVAPHIAADKAQKPIDTSRIMAAYDSLRSKSECLVVEGVGGWRVPINHEQTLGYIAGLMQLPVILVVGLRLGCINHALLTAEAVRQDGLELAGWAVSTLEKDYLYRDETLATLEKGLNCPFLAEIPHCTGNSHDQAVLNITSAGHDRLLC
ncbi:MAG: dethiobiotin synthase [Gammaproteobacteria bacterium]